MREFLFLKPIHCDTCYSSTKVVYYYLSNVIAVPIILKCLVQILGPFRAPHTGRAFQKFFFQSVVGFIVQNISKWLIHLELKIISNTFILLKRTSSTKAVQRSKHVFFWRFFAFTKCCNRMAQKISYAIIVCSYELGFDLKVEATDVISQSYIIYCPNVFLSWALDR